MGVGSWLSLAFRDGNNDDGYAHCLLLACHDGNDDIDGGACWQQNYPTSNTPQTTEINTVYPAIVPLQGESKTTHQIKLKTHIQDLTLERANVRNEREQSRLEMVRLNIIGPDFGLVRPHHRINPNRLKEDVVRAQQGKQLVADNHSFDLGMENRFPSANIFALALDINNSTIRMIEN